MKHVLILMIILSLISVPISVTDTQSTHTIPAENVLVEISYTSRDRAGSTILESGDAAWGDHVLLNATYLGPEDVAASHLSILTEDGGNFTTVSNARTVAYDTYQIGKNTTASIEFQVTLDNGTLIEFNYEGIEISNYFKPYLVTIDVSGSGGVKTITWTIDDLNSDDEHLFNVYIQHEDSQSWWLIASNITASNYDWDTTYYYAWIWQIRVEVHDNDTGFRPSFAKNESVWPALEDGIVSDPFSAGSACFECSFPGSNVSIIRIEPMLYYHPYSFDLTEGDTGHITWIKRISMFDAFPDFSDSKYSIYRNGTLLRSGTISYGSISVDIEGLSVGIYNYTLLVTHKGHFASDTIIVQILPPNLLDPNVPYLEIALLTIIGISLIGMVICFVQQPRDTVKIRT